MNGFGEMVLAKWTNLAKWVILVKLFLAKWTNLAKWVFLVKLFWPNEWIWRSGFGQMDEFGEMGDFGETILAK